MFAHSLHDVNQGCQAINCSHLVALATNYFSAFERTFCFW